MARICPRNAHIDTETVEMAVRLDVEKDRVERMWDYRCERYGI